MLDLLSRILGVPLTAEGNKRAFKNVIGDLTGHQAVAHILAGVMHNTEKAGALLAAQGMFVLAGTFALDHGWPKLLVLASLLLLVTGAMLAMSILRSTAGVFRDASEAANPLWRMFYLLRSRMIRFNIALYLTFLSTALLALAALMFVYS
jgi:hypothetical protein